MIEGPEKPPERPEDDFEGEPLSVYLLPLTALLVSLTALILVCVNSLP